MKFLVTGGAGYLGSVLLPKLLARRHGVRVVDLGYFGLDHLRPLMGDVEVIRADLSSLVDDPQALGAALAGVDAVVHLAAISNDPSAELNPELTEVVNYRTTLRLAEAARAAGARFIFSSSCSIYGQGEGDMDEDAARHPITTYAVSKTRAEEGLLELTTPDWRPISLRNGTLHGFSPRMRFDLVVNIFSLQSALYRSIKVFGPGMQWRPFLHVRDAARALIHFIELERPHYQCYNIAHENLRVTDLAEIFVRVTPSLEVIHLDVENEDTRDYRVVTNRAREDGFETRISVESGAEEMVEAILGGSIPDPESAFYRNAKWLSELSQIGSRDHRHIADLMETMARIKATPRS